jgi:signal transduction histidine kinase
VTASADTADPTIVLIVEDNPGDARLIEEMLREESEAHISLIRAASLAEAASISSTVTPDLILLDLSLPDSFGLETLRAAQAALPVTPIVVLTGTRDDATTSAALREGAQDYLVKGSVDGATMVRAIRYAIGRHEAESARRGVELELEQYRLNLEQIVADRTAELLAANEDLEDALETRSRFLASVSHELRTPLNSIIGFSHILVSGAAGTLSEEQIRQVAMINGSGRQLLELINQILDLTRITLGHEEFAIADFCASTMAAKSIASVEPLAREKGVVLAMADGERRTVMVRGDESKVRQVLLNLLSNAIKYTPNGSVIVEVRCSEDECVFTVADTGPGIPPDELPGIFDEFVRADQAGEGTGLGLPIARALARAMGGDVVAVSEVGTGSTFAFTVPTTFTGPSGPALDD